MNKCVCAPSSSLAFRPFGVALVLISNERQIESDANILLSPNKSIDKFYCWENKHEIIVYAMAKCPVPIWSCHKHILSNHRMTFSMRFFSNFIRIFSISICTIYMPLDPWIYICYQLCSHKLWLYYMMLNFIENSLVRTIELRFFPSLCLAFYQFYSNQFIA